MRDAWFRAGVGAQTLAVAHCWLLYPGTGRCGPLTNVNINININIFNGGARNLALSSPDRIRSLSQGSGGGRLCSALGTAMSEGQALDEVDSSGRPRVLGLGSAGVDFIAAVDRYPTADEKVQTQSLQVLGGGNCGNTLSAASRLGLDACLATKVGSDANGRLILQGLEEEGVDVSRVIVSDATPSAFTYVIVDKEGGTRTCLHTPQTEDILPEEITPDLLDVVAAVHLDSRHTPAAVALAKLANERSVWALPEESLFLLVLAVDAHPINARRSLVAPCCCARIGATACDGTESTEWIERAKIVLSHIARFSLVSLACPYRLFQTSDVSTNNS
ncbi:PfkB-type carbohydrate kinase [Ectocarpus siliculosus]|uniref:PfkB-type carbohydrate kinase n=1 Tax=Ectocarpus siliculosus TaxID=2880 RepID=D8LFD1_ECTSI|nr:PfkB-type carbohydrate kinase [Ectocarpus siliculosus]|eukprot:CBN75591.1 PfkB-type carbohydrate kinase [Ectocarpus siliculosus]